jgi:lysozyme
VAGVWTIGYGSTRGLTGEPITAATPFVDQATALKMLSRDASGAATAVATHVEVPLGDNQVAALTSFVYNLGAGAFEGSTLLRVLNEGDYAAAAAQFTEWDHAGGHVVQGLLNRREKEAALFRLDIASEEASGEAVEAPTVSPATTPADNG